MTVMILSVSFAKMKLNSWGVLSTGGKNNGGKASAAAVEPALVLLFGRNFGALRNWGHYVGPSEA